MKKFLLSTIFSLAFASASFAFIDDVFSSFVDLFSSDQENRIELFDHLESMSLSAYPEYFIYFETDFKNDGNPYLWISHDKNDVGSGYFFNIYKKNGERYELLPGYAIFTPEYLAFYGKAFSKTDPRLITYSKISGQEGNLVIYSMKDDKPTSFVYKTIEPMGAEAELFDKLFPEENSFVHQVPRADMIKFLESRGIKSPTKSKIEFLAFDLGGKTNVVLLATNPEQNSGAAGWSAFNLKREDTLLNDIGLNFVGVDLSLDNLIPFEVRNPGWKPLEIFPKGRKIIFFKNYSFVRKIDKRKFLITINREGLDKTSLSFYQLSFNRVCAFDIPNIQVKESDTILDENDARDAYEFMKALDFDYDKDSKYFNYQVYDAKDVVYNKNSITIPKDLDVDDDIFEIKEISLPENNKYTNIFRAKWNEVREAAKLQEQKDSLVKPKKTN